MSNANGDKLNRSQIEACGSIVFLATAGFLGIGVLLYAAFRGAEWLAEWAVK